MDNGRAKVGLRFNPGLYASDEAFEAAETGEFIGIAHFCLLKRHSKNIERLVVCLQWDCKRMTIFAAVRE